MSWRLFQKLCTEVTRLKHQKDQSLLTSAATFLRRLGERVISPAPRFAKYQPAPRLGNRPLEDRLLRRLRSTATESMR